MCALTPRLSCRASLQLLYLGDLQVSCSSRSGEDSKRIMLPISTPRAWVFTVLVLLCSIHPYLAAPIHHGLGKSEVAPNKHNMTMKGAFKSLLHFFRPMTCRLSNERPTIPCHVESFTASQCLNNHCCSMKIGQDLQCYMPVKDGKFGGVDYSPVAKCCFCSDNTIFIAVYTFRFSGHHCLSNVQLAIRLILLVGGGFLILGFLPICCCAALQRSACINPLQGMSEKVQQIAQERRERGKKTNDEEVHRHLLD